MTNDVDSQDELQPVEQPPPRSEPAPGMAGLPNGERGFSPTQPRTPEAALVDLISPLVPVANRYVDNQRKEIALRESELQRRSEFDHKVLEAEESRSKRGMLFLGGVVLGIFAVSAGLIFGKDDTQSGLLLLTHVVAIGAGVLGGMGYQAAKGSRQRDDWDE